MNVQDYPPFLPSEPLTTKGHQAAICSPALVKKMSFDFSAPLPLLPGHGSAMSSLYAGQYDAALYYGLSGGFFPDALTAGGGFPDIALAGVFPPAETAFNFPDTLQGFDVNIPAPPSPVVPPVTTNTAGNITFKFPNPPERPNAPAPPSHVVAPITHFFWRLEHTAQVEQHLELTRIQGKTQFRCTFQDCAGDVFTTKRKAYAHVYQHLGITKHYECACGVQFACIASAKRHLITRRKIFACKHCPRQYARKDYRALHQKRCGERRAQANSPNLRML